MAGVAIFGFPNVGKTTLFNALTGLDAPTASHPFSTIEPNLGVAPIPDPELERAAELEGSQKVVHASLELLDLPALAGPGHSGLPARLLARVREEDALLLVLRGFRDESVPAAESGLDPAVQAENLMLELAIADAEVFERRRERAAKEAAADAGLRRFAETISRAAALLADGIALRTVRWTDEELGFFRDLAPLTLKPAVWVVNAAEGADAAPSVAAVQSLVPTGDRVVALSARIEEEAAQLEPADRTEFLEGLGLGSGALAVVVDATHEALGLVRFYTLNPRESHAWTVAGGTPARRAAGKVHTDLERGFIRAEVASIGEVIAAGGWDSLRSAGGVRVEGRDYPVADRDVILVRFSV